MGKKSFVLYNDYQQHVEKLSDADAGQLFKALFIYANKGELSELSPTADMAFSFIQMQLDRDAEKWNDTKEKRAEAGRKSGEARRKKRNANKTNVKSVEQNGTKRTNVKSVEQNGTKRTVNVTDNVTVNVNGNVTGSVINADDSSNDIENGSEIFDTFEKCGFKITGYTAQELIELENEYSDEWVIEALKRAADRGKRTLSYVKGILNSWDNQGAIDDGVLQKKSKATNAAEELDDFYNMAAEWAKGDTSG